MNAVIAAGYGTHNGGLLYAELLTPIICLPINCFVRQYKYAFSNNDVRRNGLVHGDVSVKFISYSRPLTDGGLVGSG